MTGKLLFPRLLDSGPVSERIMAVRDGMMNLYVVQAPEGLICIDTGWRPARVSRGFEALGLSPQDVVAVLLTHMHWDHTRCLPLFPDARIFVGGCDEQAVVARGLQPGQSPEPVGRDQSVTIGGLAVRAIPTPGHTSGSMAYVVEEKWLFSGDTLSLKHGNVVPFAPWFANDRSAQQQSIRTLAAIPGVTCLLTSHTGISQDRQRAFAGWHATTDAFLQKGALT